MRPFLRPVDRARLAPVGWVSEPAGRWAGQEVEVVYDPCQHQVLLVRNGLSQPSRSAIAEVGYRRIAADGNQEMWVRDRIAQNEARLDRLERAPRYPRSAEASILRL